ncbi:MAG: carbon-nitrogen hydrolase family protein [Campylobacterales bacterium]|nr:carbon-nitrogen hydrolase family protein [Campylobacterales bacterium]
MISKSIVSLCIPTDISFENNLTKLILLLAQAPEDAIIVAPEVCLTGFDYDRFEEAAEFTPTALQKLSNWVENRLLIFTAITRIDDQFYNVAYALHDGKILHAQAKTKLFNLGGETNHFSAGEEAQIMSFNYNGIKIGILICFELRFKSLWQRLEGCDIIAIPAQWGKIRTEHFITLTNALALMNECYVIASDAHNDDTSGMSGIINPFGSELRNNGAETLSLMYEEHTVHSMRRYLNIGIKS